MDPSRRLSFGPCVCVLFIMLVGRRIPCINWLGSAWDVRLNAGRSSQLSDSMVDNGLSAPTRDRQLSTLAAQRAADVSAVATVGSQDLNLYGQPLQPCSQEGDTTTGWTRTGSCAWEPSDRGYHQVCVTMSRQFLQSSAKYDSNDLSSVVGEGGHWCICAWAWAAAVSRDPQHFENLRLDCARTNAYLRDVYRSYSASGRGMASPSGLQYEAQAALEAVEQLCRADKA
ncbi:unnamed protein product [Symbiodinium natans]|uniref:Uncharacterized protein n=1 Tax=Symbiodinium natans TaxID=878477 RepID=A0A812Q4A7_9DINO|nr:unnamed protein product [Symbiodinium natans]